MLGCRPTIDYDARSPARNRQVHQFEGPFGAKVNPMRIVFLIMTATLLGACGGGSTTLKSEKLSPTYQGPPRHVLVMAYGMSQGSSVLAEARG